MKRRTLIAVGVVGGATAAGAAWLNGAPGALARFDSVDGALRWLRRAHLMHLANHAERIEGGV